MLELKNKSILITGGTGSLGKALTKHILDNYPKVKKVVIFSRDEQKQFQMSQDFPSSKYPQIRFFIGDVRDKDKIINVISSFQKVGNVSGGILKSSKFIYFSIGFIAMVFILLLMKLNTFLDKYNK